MKRFFLFLTLLGLLTSCSKKDDNSKSSSSTSINPPAWIQGNWYEESSYDMGTKVGFRFTKDDFCNIITESYYNCFKESLEMAASIPNTPYTTKVDETITEKEYYISITSGGSTISYDFEKVSDNEIEMNGDIYERH